MKMKSESLKNKEDLELMCLKCGYTWKSEEGKQCTICNSNDNIEL